MPNQPIKFYKTGQSWDVLSNVTPIPVRMNINGQTYDAASSEAIYQGCKGIGSANPQDAITAQQLLTDPNSFGAYVQQAGKQIGNKKYANDAFYPNPSGYLKAQAGGHKVTVKEQLMYELCLAKATQNPEMLKALLESGSSPITENTALASYDDTFWGNGGQGQDKNGRNALGKVWMAVRANLQDELKRNGSIQVRSGFSDELAKTMGHTNHVPGSQLSGTQITQAQLNAIPAQNVAANLNVQRTQSMSMQPRYVQRMQSTSAQHQYALAAHQPRHNVRDIKSFAQDFIQHNPRQTKRTTPEGITYGVSGKTGGFYIEGTDNKGKPISIHIDKLGQIKENGIAVRESKYANYALNKINYLSPQQPQHQPQTTRQQYALNTINYLSPQQPQYQPQTTRQQSSSYLMDVAQNFCANNARGTSSTVGNMKFGVSGKTGGFYIEGADRHGKPINIHIDLRSGTIKENGVPVKESKYANWAIDQLQKSQHMSFKPLFSRVENNTRFPKPMPTPQARGNRRVANTQRGGI
jgi:predicted NAD-dependent protein-ADP-ribosyltransferase YbiA (DUF1768 family)